MSAGVEWMGVDSGGFELGLGARKGVGRVLGMLRRNPEGWEEDRACLWDLCGGRKGGETLSCVGRKAD